MFGGFVVTVLATFGWPHPLEAMGFFWLPAVGFWSGVYGLFTMYLPPLFPTLLRTTGAGFCYNIGRIAAAKAADVRRAAGETAPVGLPPIAENEKSM